MERKIYNKGDRAVTEIRREQRSMTCKFQNKCAEYNRFDISNCDELEILECDDRKIYEKIENKYMALR